MMITTTLISIAALLSWITPIAEPTNTAPAQRWIGGDGHLDIHGESLTLWYHGQCLYRYPVKRNGDEITLFWDTTDMDCNVDARVNESFDLARPPKNGEAFARYTIDDDLLHATYLFPEWVDRYEAVFERDIFPLVFLAAESEDLQMCTGRTRYESQEWYPRLEERVKHIPWRFELSLDELAHSCFFEEGKWAVLLLPAEYSEGPTIYRYNTQTDEMVRARTMNEKNEWRASPTALPHMYNGKILLSGVGADAGVISETMYYLYSLEENTVERVK